MEQASEIFGRLFVIRPSYFIRIFVTLPVLFLQDSVPNSEFREKTEVHASTTPHTHPFGTYSPMSPLHEAILSVNGMIFVCSVPGL